MTTDPAIVRFHMALNAPVPCMSGAAGRFSGPGRVSRSASAASDGSAGRGWRDVASRLAMTSSWRHITPLGMPVVPPV